MMSITIKNIQKAFGAKQVLNGIDYELEDGGVYCLMGPSGMGKTTLLRILMDIETPDGGNVQGLGRNDIAVMFQENHLLEWMDAIDNIAVMRRGVRDKNLKNQILAEPRLRKRILIYLNILPSDKAGWKDVPFGQKEWAQYLNANRSALSRVLCACARTA